MIGIYCRVSTESQVDGTSLDTQEQAGRLFAGATPHKVYRDEGISGGTFSRPKFEEMEADIRAGVIDKVWVLDFDRLSRARPGALDNLFIFFEKNNVKLYVNGAYQPLDDPEQMLSPYLSGILAYIERTKIRKRNKRGKLASRNEGRATFSQAYGYRQVLENGKRRWEIVEDEASVIKEIYELYLGGRTQRQIEFHIKGKSVPLRTGQWNRTVISRILNRLFYAGKTTNSSGDVIDSTRIPAIVSWEEWQKVQEIAASRNCRLADRRVGTKPILYACSAIVKCGDCGKSWIHKKKVNVEYYSVQHNPGCSQKKSYIRREIIETILYYDISQLLMSYFEIEKVLSAQLVQIEETQEYDLKHIENLQVTIQKADNKKQRLIDAIAEGTVSNSDVKNKINAINVDIGNAKRQIENINVKMKKEVEDAELMLAKFSADTLNEFQRLDYEEKENEMNGFLKRYISSATIMSGFLEVRFITGKIVKRWLPQKLVQWQP